MKKTILSLICILSMLGCCLLGGGAKVSDFTIEEHVGRITERIANSDRNWGFPQGGTYQSFAVYPLYDQNEEVNFYLVEFEPYGFVFVRVKDESNKIGGCMKTGMYMLSDRFGIDYPWIPYRIDNKGSCIVDHPSLSEEYDLVRFFDVDQKGDLILDENGELITYKKSPYFVTGNINEKKYLLRTTKDLKPSTYYICAVKKDGKFINLMSECLVFEEAEEYKFEENATIDAWGLLSPGNELK